MPDEVAAVSQKEQAESEKKNIGIFLTRVTYKGGMQHSDAASPACV